MRAFKMNLFPLLKRKISLMEDVIYSKNERPLAMIQKSQMITFPEPCALALAIFRFCGIVCCW